MASKNGKPKAPLAEPTPFYADRDPIIANALAAATFNATSFQREIFQRVTDNRRSIDDECGYPVTSVLGPDLYRDLYDRDPIAARVVQLMPRECWQSPPKIYEDDDSEVLTAFEEALAALEVSLSGSSWHKADQGSSLVELLARADERSGIGHFGVILLGLDDGLDLSQPVDGAVRVDPTANGAMPDGWMTDEEHKALVSPASYQVWNGRYDAKSGEPLLETKRPPPLTVNEARCVERWKEWSDLVGNASSATKVSREALTCNLSAAEMATRAPQWVGGQFGPTEFPAERPTKAHKLLFLRTFDESLVQVVRWESNVLNPRFGQPVMYRVTLNDPREYRSGIGIPTATVMVHWTRIVHLADNMGSSDSVGVPRIRPVLNPVLDARKIRGAAAEGYWKSNFTGLSFETNPELGGDVVIDEEAMKAGYEQYINGLQRALFTAGMTVKTLAPQVVDPTPFIAVLIESICIQLGCPVRVFKGSERGELASAQDDSAWNDRLRHRQNTYLTPRVIVPLIDRLIALGVLPEPGASASEKADAVVATNERYRKRRHHAGWLIVNAETSQAVKFISDNGYAVEWPDLDSLGRKDKAAIAVSVSQAMASYVSGQLESIMTPIDFYHRVLDMTIEDARAIVDAVLEADEADMLTEEPEPEIPAFPPGQQPGQPPENEIRVEDDKVNEDIDVEIAANVLSMALTDDLITSNSVYADVMFSAMEAAHEKV